MVDRASTGPQRRPRSLRRVPGRRDLLWVGLALLALLIAADLARTGDSVLRGWLSGSRASTPAERLIDRFRFGRD